MCNVAAYVLKVFIAMCIMTGMFLCSCEPITLDLYFSTEVSWAEEFYCFNESVGDALTMLQTNSAFNGSILLTAFPKEVVDNVIEEPFQSNGQPMNSSIKFVDFNGTRYGVGSIGE